MSTLIINKPYTQEAVLPPLAKITVDELNSLPNKGVFTIGQINFLARCRGIITHIKDGRIVGFNEE